MLYVLPPRSALDFNIVKAYKGNNLNASGKMSCPGELEEAQCLRYDNSIFTHLSVI
jgi:hypothetical protein